uniref:Ixodegrin B n=1 Tax=Rhipicephalus appendiculatus TaxID=34631 RepID=A0A131YET1_RHIAP
MSTSSVIGAMFLVLISVVPSLNYPIWGGWVIGDYFPDLGCAESEGEGIKRPTWPPGEEPTMKGVGDSCKNSSECYPGLCCLREDHVDTCQFSAMYGEKCTPGQIKGGVYHKYGPCYYGDDFCINGTCWA